MEEISGGSRSPKAANVIAAHVKQYLDFANSLPFHEALMDIIKIGDFIQYQQKIREDKRQETADGRYCIKVADHKTTGTYGPVVLLISPKIL